MKKIKRIIKGSEVKQGSVEILSMVFDDMKQEIFERIEKEGENIEELIFEIELNYQDYYEWKNRGWKKTSEVRNGKD